MKRIISSTHLHSQALSSLQIYNSDVTALIPIPNRQLDAPHDAESRCTRDHMQAISVQLRLCVRATPLPLINARTMTVISGRHCPATLSEEMIQNQRVDDAHSIFQRLLHSQVLYHNLSSVRVILVVVETLSNEV
jgi:hypothetical protein